MTLLSRRDLLAILQTGFGKSLFFQLLVRVKEILSSKRSCVIVVCGCYCFIQVLRASGWHWTRRASFRIRGFSPVFWFARLAGFSQQHSLKGSRTQLLPEVLAAASHPRSVFSTFHLRFLTKAYFLRQMRETFAISYLVSSAMAS